MSDLTPDDEHPTEDPGPGATPQQSGGALIGPAFGILLGYLVMKLLPSSTSFVLRLLIAVAVIAVVTYATLEITRRRAKR